MSSLFPEQPFDIAYGQTTLHIKPMSIPGHVAFHIRFSSGRHPLVVARAKDFNASKFWTSIPEGRQAEAEGVGKLIEKYMEQQAAT